jgi:hypothetical protein
MKSSWYSPIGVPEDSSSVKKTTGFNLRRHLKKQANSIWKYIFEGEVWLQIEDEYDDFGDLTDLPTPYIPLAFDKSRLGD